MSRPVKHGMTKTRIYSVWTNMWHRCRSPKCSHYDRYGGRGITVCARWKEFENFLEDMGDAGPGWSLDRIDNDQGYSPENCRWATPKQQQSNCRSNVNLTHDGKTMILSDWARETGIHFETLRKRLRSGWSTERVLTTLVRGQK